LPRLLWKNTRLIKTRLWKLDVSRQTATRLVDVPLSINAMAKGYIIDSVGDKAMKSAEPPGQLVINVGGDLRIWGDRKTNVAITSPFRESELPIAHVEFSDHAIATSGNYRRGFEIDGERFSHIVDPRTGRPTDRIPGVTVLAPTAAMADALATAFSVLTDEESLEIANRTPYVECLIVLKSGELAKSKGWDSFSTEHAAAESKSKTESANKELVVGFEIARPANARRFRRPYVAVWVEDEDGFPVRTLVLWIMESKPGPRWHRDLRRWFNSDRYRQLVDDKQLIGTVSSATRPSGKYKTVWDGNDDNGDQCKNGKYTLFIESAREHGTYQLIQSEFQLGGEDFTSELKGNVEISAASLDYRTATRKTGK
jgi:thiamine biosynthesis lipoprotein